METVALERRSRNRIISTIFHADGVVVFERERPPLPEAVFVGLGFIFCLSVLCMVFYIEWVLFRCIEPGRWTISGNWLCCLVMAAFLIGATPIFFGCQVFHLRLFGFRVTLRKEGDRVSYRLKSGLIVYRRVLSPRNFAAVRYFFTSRNGWICCAHIGGSFPERIFLFPEMPLTNGICGSETAMRNIALLIGDILRRRLGIAVDVARGGQLMMVLRKRNPRESHGKSVR